MTRLFLALILSTSLIAAPPEKPTFVPKMGPSMQEWYGHLQEVIDKEDWDATVDIAKRLLRKFSGSPYSQEASFYLGMAYYRLGRHELANDALGEYLQKTSGPQHFEEAILMKCQIAEFFRLGGKKRLFGSAFLPAVIPAEEDALKIYDEVIAALPHHALSLRALIGKADVQASMGDYQPSIETLDLLTRRFPKQAAEAYLQIGKVYLEQCTQEHPDLHLLDLAERNVRKFHESFPRDPRIADAENTLHDMREIFAHSLLEMGEFYQRKKEKEAALLYYNQVIAKYPESDSATLARTKLELL